MNLLHERYEILERIGKGGTSQVFLVKDHRLKTVFAMKRIEKQAILYQRDALDHEIYIMAQLHHPNIPRIIDCFTDQFYAYVVMEYIEGVSLMQVLQETHEVKQQVLLEWMLQMAKVFCYLHSHEPQPILYLDFKPQNLLLDKKGKLYLIDFGSSCLLHHIHVRSATPGYAPQELIKQHAPCLQSDIYSFGRTFYVLYHGHFPDGQKRQDAVDRLLLTCCEEAIEKRYTSFQQVYAAIQKEQIRSSRHFPYMLLLLFLCVMFLLFGIACYSCLKQEHTQHYLRYMKQQKYKEALKWKSDQLEPYVKLYSSLCKDGDGKTCRSALLEVEEQAVLYGREKDDEIALFLAGKFMLLKDSFGYEKAQSYYAVIDNDNKAHNLASSFKKLNQLLWKQTSNSQDLRRLESLLTKISEECTQLSDPLECFQYQKLLLMVYDNNHDRIKNGEKQLLDLCDDMLTAIQKNPRLFSWEEKAYVEEFQAMGFYYMGYECYLKEDYEKMMRYYDLAIERMKSTQLENRYELLVDMELSCFQYGIKDEEKPLHIKRLMNAKNFAERIKDQKEQTYFINKIQEEMTYWRN